MTYKKKRNEQKQSMRYHLMLGLGCL